MLETSRDLLNIVIAASIFLFTVFVCWAIYYFAQILRQTFKIISEMRGRLQKIDEFIKMLKDKIDHSTSYLLLIGEGVKKLVEIAGSYTGEKKKGRSRK
jgi:predicted PurR-regulated permease PerM